MNSSSSASLTTSSEFVSSSGFAPIGTSRGSAPAAAAAANDALRSRRVSSVSSHPSSGLPSSPAAMKQRRVEKVPGSHSLWYSIAGGSGPSRT